MFIQEKRRQDISTKHCNTIPGRIQRTLLEWWRRRRRKSSLNTTPLGKRFSIATWLSASGCSRTSSDICASFKCYLTFRLDAFANPYLSEFSQGRLRMNINVCYKLVLPFTSDATFCKWPSFIGCHVLVILLSLGDYTHKIQLPCECNWCKNILAFVKMILLWWENHQSSDKNQYFGLSP